MIRSLRVPFIVIVAVACAVDQPLPPANNPKTVSKLCGPSSPCADGLVCHRAIGGGACGEPCAASGAPDHGYCGSLVAGYVCHPSLNQCAPACDAAAPTSDTVCKALGSGYVCKPGGACVFEAESQTAFVTLFNATSAQQADLALSGAGTLITATAPGAISARAMFTAGAHDFTVTNTVSGTLATGSTVFVAGHRYYVVVYLATGVTFEAVVIDAAQPSTPVGQNAWLWYRHLAAGLSAQTFGANGQALFNELSFKAQVDPVQASASASEFSVGPPAPTLAVPPAKQPRSLIDVATMTDTATLVPRKSYVAVTWPGTTGVLPETTIFGEDGIVARMQAAGLRVADVSSADARAVKVWLDKTDAEIQDTMAGITAPPDLTTAMRLQTAPASGYKLMKKGTHRVIVDVGSSTALSINAQPFSAGATYTIYVHGKLVDPRGPGAKFLADSDATAPAANNVMWRAINFAAMNPGTLEVERQVPGPFFAITAVPLAYEAIGPFRETTLAANVEVEARFIGGIPAIVHSSAFTPGAGRFHTVILTGSETNSATDEIVVFDDRGDHQLVSP
ncbi:MAG: hypothetical protein IT381_18860 [Deltaproteobacteria bacterium]|nr:hypothetical protein [Deltaproteobacteria bacterium]